MANDYFEFKQFRIRQSGAAFKIGTDGVLLGACSDMEGASSVLDIGTGTGLIALMAAQRSDAEVIAIEPEAASFLQASENIKLCKWAERITVIHTGFNDYYKTSSKKFDVIITNPPFFRDSLKNPDSLKSATRHAESLPSHEILEGAKILLEDKGNLQLILPFAEGGLFIGEAREYGFFCNRIINVKPVPDGGISRLIMKFEKTSRPLLEKYLTIETGIRHQYTAEYKEIIKDFYLNY